MWRFLASSTGKISPLCPKEGFKGQNLPQIEITLQATMHPYHARPRRPHPAQRPAARRPRHRGRPGRGGVTFHLALLAARAALEEAGVIAGYHAHLHRQRVGWGVLGFVQLALHDHTAETTSALEREVMAMPQVLSCHNLSGRYDYQLEVVAADLESFADYVRTHVRSLPGVREISTSFSLKEVKRTMALPV
jgi:Lrp/AsnC family leucine-responsive transcriptional regulator